MKGTKGYICDRCGKKKDEREGFRFKVGGLEIREVGWITLRCKTGYNRDIDLCDNCMEELGSWLSNKS